MSLLTELDAFYTEHGRCGELDGGGVDGPVVWLDCACGARMARRADEYATQGKENEDGPRHR